MPAMTDTDATPAAGADASDDPRRLVLADLVLQLAAGVAARARHYEAAARQAGGNLRQALEALARAKHAQATDLAPLASALGVSTPLPPPASPLPGPASWGIILGEAFQGERAMEAIARELAILAADPPLKALGMRLAAGAARDGQGVRKLYLRYS
jgi:hypothetical protein